MRSSPLAALHPPRGEMLAEYRGSLAAAGDGGATAWPPTRTQLFDACWRAVLEVRGPEARKWLNGMITANVRDLPPGGWAPSFVLDPRGHVLACLDVACLEPDRFLLLTDEEQRAALAQRLRGFVFVSKLEIVDQSEAWSAVWLRGPEAEAGWRQAGLPELSARAPGELAAVTLAGGDGWVLASRPGGFARLEIVAPAAALPELWRGLAAAAAPAGAAAAERDRILSREPRYGVDVTDRELPQETGQMERLDFTKGCYVGQEIVERVRARGAVHRHWRAIRFRAPVEAGAVLEAEGKAVGALTSAAARNGDWLGLGYLRDPAAAPGAGVTAGGAAGEVEP